MDKKSAIILSLLGVGPISNAMATEPLPVEQLAYSVNERTTLIVRQLIESDALYANADATQLLIRRSALTLKMIAGLESSNEVKIDPKSGDFIVRPDFAIALINARALDGMSPKTVQDFSLLQKLRRDSAGGVSIDLTNFASTPFFK